ncbi:putative calcineurin binding protein [Aspergillus glaucus CBS 516.65]|uniref:Calcipressin n=1 Tax=Aspergillus glaucus CBS 516.65 TaxID=1160497 RepID=A0A1L9V9J7_ASPGL|nr:hypothetical protein ASPGLDRAFT_69376 [Aspergillus glaucus CBS 516.65]OJJ80601.1 hypothetical protein ASPGLDRAFT_69376 [Aspergillus glaucus CBS 516.65]
MTSFSANRSRSSSTSSRPALSLDLSNLPPLTTPTPPTNTLLITNLLDLTLFQPPLINKIRETITSVAPLNSFSPLPSLRRIICSFHATDDAVTIRKMLDGDNLGSQTARAKIYFGEPTPILDENEARHPKNFLQAPQVDKLFFISPPPSPPAGWVLRQEDPPNKEVHASDLASALESLKTENSGSGVSAAAAPVEEMGIDTPISFTSEKRMGSWPVSDHQRSRSSTLIYVPEDHGSSPDLPAVMVEDTTTVELEEPSPIDMAVKKMPPKTSMPPVELM